MIETAHLAAIAAIARQPSLSKASETLHMSQSGLSHLVRKLEKHLGRPVLDRRRRPASLTPVGVHLATRAQEILRLINDTEAELRGMRCGLSDRLYITLECHTCIEWLSPTFDRYRQEYPDVDLDLRMGSSFDPMPALLAGGSDLIITAERHAHPGVHADPLFRYEIVGVVRADHPLAAKPHLEPSDFRGQTVITYPVAKCRLDLYTRFLDPAGIAPGDRRTAELTAMIVQWVAGGTGLAALPRWALSGTRADLAIVPLGPDGLQADLHALRRAGDAGTPHLDAFIALVKHGCFAELEHITPIPY